MVCWVFFSFGFSAPKLYHENPNKCMIMVYGEARQHLIENHGLALIQWNANQHSIFDSALHFLCIFALKFVHLNSVPFPECWDWFPSVVAKLCVRAQNDAEKEKRSEKNCCIEQIVLRRWKRVRMEPLKMYTNLAADDFNLIFFLSFPQWMCDEAWKINFVYLLIELV